MNNRHTFSIGYFVLVLMALLVAQSLFAGRPEEVSYSDFKQRLAADQVQDATLSDTLIRGTLKPEKEGEKGVPFVTVPVADDQLVSQLEAHGVKFRGQYESAFLNALLAWVLPAVVFVGIWLLAMWIFGALITLGLLSFNLPTVRAGTSYLPHVLAGIGYPGLLAVTLLFVWRFLASLEARSGAAVAGADGAAGAHAATRAALDASAAS